LLSDEKKLDEERELASQTKNRYKGTGNTSGGFGGSYGGQGRYGGESYEGMGSDAQYKKKREEPRRERERERERDPQDYNPSSGGKYDPHTGSNSLFKKLGIQEKRDEPEQKDDDIEFPAEPTPPKQETRAPISAPTQTQPQKPAPKFLPPPPSKGGAAAQTPGTQTSPPLKVQASGTLA
jgi:hypothetical protein